jgi:hypothetical protein
MNDRHIASTSKPRRRCRYVRSAADLIRSATDGSFLVANENWVSRLSETRVTEGAASLAAMSRIAARPSAQVGKR